MNTLTNELASALSELVGAVEKSRLQEYGFLAHPMAHAKSVLRQLEYLGLYSTDDPPFGTLQPPPSWQAELMLIGAAMRKRHPSHGRCSSKVVTGKLTTIMRDTPDSERSTVLRYIDSQHAKWCACPRWKEEGGKFAKSLEAWLNPARRLWENEPLAVESVAASKSDEFWAGI